jgi:hypothetical protein
LLPLLLAFAPPSIAPAQERLSILTANVLIVAIAAAAIDVAIDVTVGLIAVAVVLLLCLHCCYQHLSYDFLAQQPIVTAHTPTATQQQSVLANCLLCFMQ